MTSIIHIAKAYKFFGGKEKYPTTSARQSFCSRIKNFIKYGVVQGDIHNKEVDIESLKKYLEFESNVLDNYMNISEFRKLIGVSKEISAVKIKKVFAVWEIEFFFDYVEPEFPIYNHTFFISKLSVKRFFNDYISMDAVKSKVSKNSVGWQRTLKRLRITQLKIGMKCFIKKSAYEKIIDVNNEKLVTTTIKDAYKYIGGKKKYPTESKRSSLKIRIRNLIQHGIIKGKMDNNLVDIESLKEHFALESNITENYISIKEFHELLGTNKDTTAVEFKEILTGIESEYSFKYVETEYPIYYRTFFISKSSVKSFLEEYVSMDEVEGVISKSHSGWSKSFKRLQITPLKIGHKRFIKKSEYKVIIDDASAIINKSDYYTLEEFKQILSLPYNRDSMQIEKDYNLKPKKVYGHWKFYKKALVEDLKVRQTELRKAYISFEEAKEVANFEGFPFHTGYIKSEPVDSLLRPFYKDKSFLYLKETFNNWLDTRRKKSEFFSVSVESNIDTFNYRLNIKKIDINALGIFTSETWLQFISSKLNRSKASLQTVDRYIYTYVYCTESIINLVTPTKKKEIYSVTSNEINTLFNEIPKKYSLVIYQYLRKVNNQLTESKMKGFDFNKVNDPSKLESEIMDKSIYEYETYKKLYNYAKDISIHKDRAIKDILKDITMKNGEGNVKYYASSWLYVLLHLNNAWRHSDVIIFPQVNLSGTKIVDLNWMLENELSNEDADYIIKQLYRAEIFISKTQVKNYFFCSDELKKAFATAIAICQLRIEALSPLRESIIDFGNKKQNFSDTRRKYFFEQYDDEDFHFSSRKMNRSLMSYIYVLLSRMQKGTSGLKTIQKMRGHQEKETTNIYVDIPMEELNFLTRQLFARGSFGFIYDTFLDVLQGVEIDREKRTIEIQFLQKYFGSIHDVEGISNFLNTIQNERKAIIDHITSMGLDEALEFVNKIETNQLPSKQDNVQCMLSETGCVKKGQGTSCFDCAYSIPNYYALSALGESIQDRLNNYLNSLNSYYGMSYYEQRKRARLFYIQLDVFSQAIQRFGFDVYKFITDSREEFKSHLAQIDSLKEKFQLKME